MILKRTRFVFVSIALLLLVACSTSPTGRKQFAILPNSMMNSLGAQSFDGMKQQVPAEKDPQTNTYVRCVSEAVLREAKDTTGVKTWEIVVFKDESANAFALPGGKIGVHTGLLKVATNQDQLATVIGHEIGHVIAQHANERMSETVGVQLAAAALAGQSNDPATQQKIQLAMVGYSLGRALPHGRTQESESDQIGLDLMAKAGFDPQQSISLWENMAKAGGGQPPEFLSTHPSHSTRIENLRSWLPKAQSLRAQAKAQGKVPRCRL